MINKVPLESSRWKSLKSYGDPGEIPCLIRQLQQMTDPGTIDRLSDLQDYIYQQYVSSEAAYAVVPWLVEIGSRLGSEQDPYIWILIGHIAATSNIVGDPAPMDLLPDFRAALAAAEPMCLNMLLNGGWDLLGTYYLATAATAMAGNAVGKLAMDNLSPKPKYGESFANCPGCAIQVRVAFFDDGLVVAQNSTPASPKPQLPAEPRKLASSVRSSNPWLLVKEQLQEFIGDTSHIPGAVPHLEASVDLSSRGVTPDVPAEFGFSLIGSLLMLKGYSKPAMRYFHAWDSIKCTRCGSTFVFADHWWAWEPKLGWVGEFSQAPV
jgi:hypothetical protein